MIEGKPSLDVPGQTREHAMRSAGTRVWGTVILLLLLSAGGCASSGGGSGGGSANSLTREQLIETRQPSLYQAIQALRPRWLRARGAASLSGPTEVTVFLNETPYGTVQNLSSIPIEAVQDVRYLSASEAGARYGTNAGNGGLILVRTRS